MAFAGMVNGETEGAESGQEGGDLGDDCTDGGDGVALVD